MMKTPTKFLPVKMPKCNQCGDTGWKPVPPSYPDRFPNEDSAAHANTVSPCLCERGIEVTDGYEIANEKRIDP